jgi:hypothetical protein
MRAQAKARWSSTSTKSIITSKYWPVPGMTLCTCPARRVSFSTTTRERAQKFRNVTLSALDASGRLLDAVTLGQRGILFPAFADLEFELNAQDQLIVNWKTTIGTSGVACATRSLAGEAPFLKPLPIDDWNSFKEYVGKLERNKYIFRGQSSNKWRLRTSFHRTRRANLNKYEASDVAQLHRYLSSLTRIIFDLKNPIQNLSFMNLAQHHGYPTPLLDWTRSPYVAAFFAYRNFTEGRAEDDKVRIFKLDGPAWRNVNRELRALAPVPPALVLMEALPLENPRVIPQQSLSTVSTVDDVETHIRTAETNYGRTFLEVIDLPANARKEVIGELALMGITAGSLFPGMDGACEALREQNFRLFTRY